MLSKLLRKQQLSRWFNLTLINRVGGKQFKIPVFSKMGMGNYFMTELWMLDVLQHILPSRPGVFVDIGANIGQTLIKLRSLTADVPYVGIEPNPSCIFYLRELIRSNNFKHCQIIPAGIFVENDLRELTLLEDDDVDSGATLFDTGEANPPNMQHQFVALLPFDRIRQRLKLDSICVIKIDVEGAELEVLQSLGPTLDSLHPLLMLEILPVYRPENTMLIKRQQQTEALLASRHYSLARICKTRNGRLAGLKLIQEIGIHSDLALSDYLAYPSEKHQEIVEKFILV